MEWLLWPEQTEGMLGETTLRSLPLFGVWGTLAAVVALLLLIAWTDRVHSHHLAGAKRGALVALRVLAILCLLPILYRLSLRGEVEHDVQPVLAVAVDTSRSMGLADRTGNAGAEGRDVSRLDAVRALLGTGENGALARLDAGAQLQYYEIAGDLISRATLAGDVYVQQLSADGDYTALGNALRSLGENLRGRPTAGVLLFSDGSNNTGLPPEAAAEVLREAGVPVHAVAVGDPNPRDIEIRQIIADDLFFTGDPVTIVVRLRQRGYAGQRVSVNLTRGDQQIASADAAFTGDQGELNIPLTFTPEQAGEFTFRVEAPVQPEETVAENNDKSFFARVTSEKIRVLMLEQRPRWQFRFLRDAMDRDKRLDLDILLAGAEPVANPIPPYINTLPETREAFDRYDLIILGDFDPAILTTNQLEALRQAVQEDGVGMLLLAGPFHNPRSYVATPLEDLFPIETANRPGTVAGRPRATQSDRFTPELTAAGRVHPALQLADQADANLDRWQGLPGIFWFAPVAKARPGASVLLVHPTETTDNMPPEPLPLMALQRFGRGRVLYAGIDETWRWRLKQGDRNFYRLWGQVVQYLGAPHLAGEETISVRTDRTIYNQGETALVTVRMDELAGADPVIVVETDEGEQERYPLNPAPGAERYYEARMPLDDPGQVRIWLEGHSIEAMTVVEVEAPQVEMQDPAANLTLLRELAQSTGGQYARPEDFDTLVANLDLAPVRVVESRDYTLWDRPLLVLFFVTLVGLDWIFRRLWQLP